MTLMYDAEIPGSDLTASGTRFWRFLRPGLALIILPMVFVESLLGLANTGHQLRLIWHKIDSSRDAKAFLDINRISKKNVLLFGLRWLLNRNSNGVRTKMVRNPCRRQIQINDKPFRWFGLIIIVCLNSKSSLVHLLFGCCFSSSSVPIPEGLIINRLFLRAERPRRDHARPCAGEIALASARFAISLVEFILQHLADFRVQMWD